MSEKRKVAFAGGGPLSKPPSAPRYLAYHQRSDLASVARFGRFEQLGYKGNCARERFNDKLWAKPPAAAGQKMFDAMQTVLYLLA